MAKRKPACSILIPLPSSPPLFLGTSGFMRVIYAESLPDCEAHYFCNSGWCIRHNRCNAECTCPSNPGAKAHAISLDGEFKYRQFGEIEYAKFISARQKHTLSTEPYDEEVPF